VPGTSQKLTLAALLAAGAVVAPTPASAPAATQAAVLVAPSVVTAGQPMRISGTGWRRPAPCRTSVDVRLTREGAVRRTAVLGPVRVDRRGRFAVPWRTPATATGRWTLRVTLECGRQRLRAVRPGLLVRVPPPAPAPR
jgi:hypothetical protein